MTTNEKRSHEFEKEQGEVYARVWTEEKEESNIIIISKIKKTEIEQ